MNACLKSLLAVLIGCIAGRAAGAAETNVKGAPSGWTTLAPREEVKPSFRYEAQGGRGGREVFIISGDERDGTSGWWQKKFPIEGGKTYHFSAWRKTEGVASVRQSGLARVKWRDEKGNAIKRDERTVGRYLHGSKATAEPEYPTDKATDAAGWTEVSDTYEIAAQAPRGASGAPS